MKPVFVNIPNTAFNALVREFTFAHEKPVFTVQDTFSTFLTYIEIAIKEN